MYPGRDHQMEELVLYLLLLNFEKLKENVGILMQRKFQIKTFQKAIAIGKFPKFVFDQKHNTYVDSKY